jgi:serine/threonine protein kinase
MSLGPGANVLHYRIVEKLGEGGMGVVWKALDTTLDRTVALKMLPGNIGDDVERLARFEHEAKSLAALNHPNVASLFGLHATLGSPGSGDADGIRFLTMELVEGEDLAQRIARGALPHDQAVRIAIGIAEALTAAHARGIIHRDLKPANVMLDAEGIPKVLDFGLAKTAVQAGTASGSADPGTSPTLTSFGTVDGALLGTAAYMSPEQARGKPVDKRADTWALGCILLEMLTGKSPFAGDTISDTLASVLKSEPDWEALPSTTPRATVRILRRSLAKKARDRWQDAGDLRCELEHVGEPTEVTEAIDGRRRVSTGVAATLLIGGIVLGALLWHVLIPNPPAAETTARSRTVSEISALPGVVFGVTQVDLALSPDGSRLAYAGTDQDGNRQLYLRSLAGGSTKKLPDTTGANKPFWSPDGSQIAFHAGSEIRRIGLDDSQSRTIIEAVGTSGAWSEDGFVYFCSNNSLPVQTVHVETGTIGSVPHAQVDDGGGCNSVSLLPDGKHLVFEAVAFSGGGSGIFLAALDSDKIEQLYSLKTNIVYSAGHLLFHDGPQLLAQRIDTETSELIGDSFVVANPVFETNFPFHALFTAARERPRLIYLEGTGESLQTELVWFDRQGNEVERTGIIGDLYSPRLSKDARRLLLDVSTYETEGDIWLFDLARGSSRRLTNHPLDESRPSWSPDEKTVHFFRVPDLYKIDLAGNAEPVLVVESDKLKYTSDVSIDGKVTFSVEHENQDDISFYDIESGEVTSWLSSPANEAETAFSPDGKWLAYQSDETGDREIYVDRFPQRGERFQVSHGGGRNASWRADGKELYYVSLTDEIIAVPVDLDSDRRPIGKPEPLFRPRIRQDMFTPHPSGERFLVVLRMDPEIDRGVLVDDWVATSLSTIR